MFPAVPVWFLGGSFLNVAFDVFHTLITFSVSMDLSCLQMCSAYEKKKQPPPTPSSAAIFNPVKSIGIWLPLACPKALWKPLGRENGGWGFEVWVGMCVAMQEGLRTVFVNLVNLI